MPPVPQPQTPGFNVAQAFAQALRLHEQGRLAEAERLYSDVLAARPDHFDSLQMLGMIKLAKGQAVEALRFISAAMELRAPSPQILVNRGIILNALERRQEALDSFDQAIRQKSKYAEAHNNRGAVLAALQRDEEAIESFRKAIASKPDYAEAHYNLGSSLRALTRYDEALKPFERAIALRPNYAKAHNNRGAVLEALGKRDDALAAYDRALALMPAFAEARLNRGRVLAALDRSDEALDNFNIAVANDPNSAEAYYNRGKVFIDQNRNDEAAADFARALALKPGYAEARFAACFAELPIVYADAAEIQRRRAAYEEKLRALKADVEAGRLQGDLVKAIAAKQPFLLAYQGGNDRPLQEIYGATVSRIIAQHYPAAELAAPPAPGEPIRVGVVSSFFYLHSNWKIPIKGWIGQLDRSRFRIYGYHLGSTHDQETDAAAAMCDRFVHRVLDVDGWRREITADRPHVLIYPGLLMDNFSLQLAAQRLAPVQMTSWGHPETSGLPTLDYFLSSDAMEAADADSHYTEKLVRLPNLSIYYEEPLVRFDQVTRAELGLRDDAAVFWSGQSLYKYLPQYDDVFARIAKQVPNSQFVFLRHHGGPQVTQIVQDRLQRAFAAHGLKTDDHVVFLGRMSQSQFGAAMGLADMFLDSIGWSGCNSALESLPHNLPIVTLAGPMMRGRHCAAILSVMGLGDTVARDIDGYVARAVHLAQNADARKDISARIAAGKHALYHDRAPVTALEQLIETAVRGH
jgi:predicted O-linked N-acetylglucosamine transferase (SPINDLY family)